MDSQDNGHILSTDPAAGYIAVLICESSLSYTLKIWALFGMHIVFQQQNIFKMTNSVNFTLSFQFLDCLHERQLEQRAHAKIFHFLLCSAYVHSKEPLALSAVLHITN